MAAFNILAQPVVVSLCPRHVSSSDHCFISTTLPAVSLVVVTALLLCTHVMPGTVQSSMGTQALPAAQIHARDNPL